jgi:putative endonuclease
MTNKYKTTLYIGITNNLQRRIYEHRTHYQRESFTSKYNLEYCVYYEYFPDMEQAIGFEKN